MSIKIYTSIIDYLYCLISNKKAENLISLNCIYFNSLINYNNFNDSKCK